MFISLSSPRIIVNETLAVDSKALKTSEAFEMLLLFTFVMISPLRKPDLKF